MPDVSACSGSPGAGWADLTYPEVGATRGPLPAGYRQLAQGRRIGLGPKVFGAATEVLFGWDMHRRAGLRVRAEQPWAQVGSTVVLGLPRVLRAVGMAAAPCRVVYVVDEPMRKGFAYGTLPGHPECGEEAFMIEMDPETGEVLARITAFSRPAHWLVRLGGPLGRAAQAVMARRYLSALAG